MDWGKWVWAALLLIMLPGVYRNAKWWLANGPKPQSGDWANVLFIMGMVVLFVLLLIMSVQ